MRKGRGHLTDDRGLSGGGGGSRITTSIKISVNDCKCAIKIPLFFNAFSRKCKLGVIVVKHIRGIVRGQNCGMGSKGKAGENPAFFIPARWGHFVPLPHPTLQTVKATRNPAMKCNLLSFLFSHDRSESRYLFTVIPLYSVIIMLFPVGPFSSPLHSSPLPLDRVRKAPRHPFFRGLYNILTPNYKNPHPSFSGYPLLSGVIPRPWGQVWNGCGTYRGGAAQRGRPFFRHTPAWYGGRGVSRNCMYGTHPHPTQRGTLIHPTSTLPPSSLCPSPLLPSLSPLPWPSCSSLLSVCLPLPSPLHPSCLSPSPSQRPTRTTTPPVPLGSVCGTPSPPGQKKRPGIPPRPFRIIPASPPRTQQRRPSPAQSGDPLLHR